MTILSESLQYNIPTYKYILYFNIYYYNNKQGHLNSTSIQDQFQRKYSNAEIWQ